MRIVRVIGLIDEDSFATFSADLSELEKSEKPIEIELNSGGGNDFDALAFVSRIRRSPCTINVTGVGFVASAATMILVSGTGRRRLCKDAWVMLHESHERLRGMTSHLAAEVRRLQRAEDHWCRLMEEYTGTKASYWRDLNSQGDTYLTAVECLEYGMIDEIV